MISDEKYKTSQNNPSGTSGVSDMRGKGRVESELYGFRCVSVSYRTFGNISD